LQPAFEHIVEGVGLVVGKVGEVVFVKVALDIAVEATFVLAMDDAALAQVVPFAEAGTLLAGERAARVPESTAGGAFSLL